MRKRRKNVRGKEMKITRKEINKRILNKMKKKKTNSGIIYDQGKKRKERQRER